MSNFGNFIEPSNNPKNRVNIDKIANFQLFNNIS